ITGKVPPGGLTGKISVTNPSGTATSAAEFTVDSIPPTISLTSPKGGEVIAAGSSFTIQFDADDNDALSSIAISLSLDGGATFPTLLGTVAGTAHALFWNSPTASPSALARIQVVATDRAGNTASAMSGDFTIIT